MGAPDNRDQGNTYEGLFVQKARIEGFTALKNHQTCRWIPGGRAIPMDSPLDFTLITQKGKVGYFDIKSFNQDYFTYSMLEQHQIDQSILFNDLKVPSGFIVFFQSKGQVRYYPGHLIAKAGPRSRFDLRAGVLLGSFQTFSLIPVLAPVKSRSGLLAY